MADNADNSGISGYADSETKLRKDGQPDHRFKEHGGGSHGNQGGRQTGFVEEGDGTSRLRTDPAGATGEDTNTHKPSLHNGQTKDGGQDARTTSEHGFGGDREFASQQGQKGGSASYANDGLTH